MLQVFKLETYFNRSERFLNPKWSFFLHYTRIMSMDRPFNMILVVHQNRATNALKFPELFLENINCGAPFSTQCTKCPIIVHLVFIWIIYAEKITSFTDHFKQFHWSFQTISPIISNNFFISIFKADHWWVLIIVNWLLSEDRLSWFKHKK